MKIKNTHAVPALMIVVFALLVLSNLLEPALLGMRENPYFSVIILQLLIFALPSLFFCKFRSVDEGEQTQQRYRSRLRLTPFTGEHILLVILSCVVLILLSCAIKIGLTYLFPESWTSSFSQTYLDFVYTSDGVFQTMYTILTFALLPAITEEFLCRSILVAEYETDSIFCAVIMSSLMFAMIHMDFALFALYFVSGILLCFVLYATRSVFSAMVVHFVNNVFHLYLESYVWKIIARPQNTVIFLFVLILLLLIFLVLMFAEAERVYHNYGILNRNCSYVPERFKRKKKKLEDFALFRALIAFPFLLLVVFFLIASVWL